MRELKFVADFKSEYLDLPGSYSFLNFASIDSYLAESDFDRISYFADGMLMAAFVSMLTGQKIKRISFDFTSIANVVFEKAEIMEKPVYIIGANDEQVEKFRLKLMSQYPGLILAGVQSGYVKSSLVESAAAIALSGARVVVIGMGAGLQEKLSVELLNAGYAGVAFTCGGFIRQEAGSVRQYYPKWIDRANLRWAYRMYKEPHTIRRYILSYPINAIKLAAHIITGRVRIKGLG